MSRKIYFTPMTYEEYKENKICTGCCYDSSEEAREMLFCRFKKSYNIKKIDFNPYSTVFEWDACICMIEEENVHDRTKYPVEYFKLEKKFNDIHLIDLIQILNKQERVYIEEKENNNTSYISKHDRVIDIPEKYYNYKVLAISQDGTYYIMIEKGE